MSAELVDYAEGEIYDPPQAHFVACLVTGGCGQVRSRINAGRAVHTMVAPGWFLPIVPPGCTAEFQTSGDMRHLVLTIPAVCFEPACGDVERALSRLDRLFETGFADPLLTELAKRLLNESGSIADPQVAAALQNTFCLMLCRAADALPESGGTARPFGPAQFRKILSQLEENLSCKMTLAAISGRHGMSEREFSAAFKATTETTLRQYQIGLRIERAKSLLKTGQLELVEIADVTGFSDQAHFTSTFTRRVGISPARYRRNLC